MWRGPVDRGIGSTPNMVSGHSSHHNPFAELDSHCNSFLSPIFSEREEFFGSKIEKEFIKMKSFLERERDKGKRLFLALCELVCIYWIEG